MKKINDALAASCISLFLLGAFSTVAFAQQNIPSLIKRTQPAVIQILVSNTIGTKSGRGSGFIINQNGDIITNWHVISNTTNAVVITASGAMYTVKGIIAKDEKRDIVKLALDTTEVRFPYLTLSSHLPSVGEQIFAIGNPKGLSLTVSDGIVSAVREWRDNVKVIQISALISQGSSGGPVINVEGKVIGIASFGLEEGQNLNFAYTAKDIARLLKSASQEITPLSLLDTEESRHRVAKRYVQSSMSHIIDTYVNSIMKRIIEKRNEDEKLIRAYFYDKFLTKVIEIMIKHYSIEELNAMADFYDRPIGKSILSKFNDVMADTVAYLPEMDKELEKVLSKAK